MNYSNGDLLNDHDWNFVDNRYFNYLFDDYLNRNLFDNRHELLDYFLYNFFHFFFGHDLDRDFSDNWNVNVLYN